MNIAENLKKIKSTLPKSICLVAVSKTKPNEDILEAYHAGHRHFGENKAQELINKHPELPKDINWHFIGHLQTNKVKYIVPFVYMIEAVDSLKLFKEINKQALKHSRIINCLLQFHIAEESSKFGFDLEEAKEILISEDFKELENIQIAGVMGMATYTDEIDQVRREFKTLKRIFDQLKESHFKNDDRFKEISMGMSGDYEVAIEEGSTIVRVGSAIFGLRNYH